MSEYTNVARLANSNFEAIRQLTARVEALEKQIAEILKGQQNNGN